MIKTAGEHLVCSMLARHGWAPAMTRDGIARTDILAVSTVLPNRPTVEVQVKAASERAETNFPLGEKAQQLAASDREWFVFVMLPTPPRPPRCFVVPRNHVAAATWAVHMEWATDPKVAPGTRNTPVSQARVHWEAWEMYEDRWDLLGSPTEEVPILLPDFVRDCINLERVGLPAEHPWSTQPPAWLQSPGATPSATPAGMPPTD
jgi:hypothetical protein